MAATREQVINEFITRVRNEGIEKAIADAKKYDDALKGVDIASDKVEKGAISAARGLERVNRQIDPLYAATKKAEQAERDLTRAFEQGLIGAEEYVTKLLKVRGANDNLVFSTGKAKTALGFTGEQVKLLSFQFNDLATMLATGQSPLRAIASQGGQIVQVLQMSEGGVRGALKGVADGIKGIGPIALTAFGAAGVVGAVGLAASALSSLQKDLERTDARLRALNGTAADAIEKGAKAATAGTNLNAADAQGLSTLATRNAQKLGLSNPDELTRSAAALSQQMRATADESKQALDSVTSLLSGVVVTGEQAIKFVQQFPQFAGAMAKAFDTTSDKLVDLDPKVMRTSAVVAQTIADIGKNAQTSGNLTNDFWKSLKDAAVAFDNLTGLSDKWDGFWSNVAKGLGVITQGMNDMAAAAQAAGNSAATGLQQVAQAVQAAQQAQASTQALQNVANSMAGNMTGAAAGYLTSNPQVPGATQQQQPLQYTSPPPIDPDRMKQYGTNSNDIVDPLKEALKDTVIATQDDIENLAKNTQNAAQNNIIATRDTGKAIVTSYGNGINVWRAKTDENTASTRQGLSDVERAIRDMASKYTDPLGDTSTAQKQDSTMLKENQQIQIQGQAGTQFHWNPFTGGSFDVPKNLAANFEKADDYFARKRGTATASNDNGGSSSGSSPLDGISDAIAKLRDQQNAVMQRAYTPDAYKDKNPDLFYSGGRIFAEQQDKIWEGLQSQIDALTQLRTQGEALLQQNAAMPAAFAEALVSALVAAGLTGDQIAKALSGLKSTATGSAQPGPLKNRLGSTPLRMALG